jgi:hypothetical protein
VSASNEQWIGDHDSVTVLLLEFLVLVCGNGETREVKEDERGTHTHTQREKESDKTRRGASFFFRPSDSGVET